jgi:hypothetical protein
MIMTEEGDELCILKTEDWILNHMKVTVTNISEFSAFVYNLNRFLDLSAIME